MEGSKEEFMKGIYYYVVKISNSYKRISGLLTGFTLTSLIFLYSNDYENSVQFNNVMWIIAFLTFAFFSLFFGVLGYYIVEGRAYGIKIDDELQVSKKNVLINKLRSRLDICHSFTGMGALSLMVTILFLLYVNAIRAFDIFIFMIGFGVIFIIGFTGCIAVVLLIHQFITKRRVINKN